jgi:hypothetical protein
VVSPARLLKSVLIKQTEYLVVSPARLPAYSSHPMLLLLLLLPRGREGDGGLGGVARPCTNFTSASIKVQILTQKERAAVLRKRCCARRRKEAEEEGEA